MKTEEIYILTYAQNGSLTSRKILDMADEELMNAAINEAKLVDEVNEVEV